MRSQVRWCFAIRLESQTFKHFQLMYAESQAIRLVDIRNDLHTITFDPMCGAVEVTLPLIQYC